MSCSTYTVRSSSLGGKPSSWPLAMARISVDCSKEEGQHDTKCCVQCARVVRVCLCLGSRELSRRFCTR